jgi:hypothetical protein
MMDAATILAMIDARAAMDAEFAALVKDRNDVGVAAALSAGRVRAVETFGGYGYVMERLGPTGGASLLDALESMAASSPPIKWAFRLLERGALDFGSAATRAQLDALVGAGVLPAPAAGALKAGAEVADPVSVSDVSAALNARERGAT